jgi:hypothetical protein
MVEQPRQFARYTAASLKARFVLNIIAWSSGLCANH